MDKGECRSFTGFDFGTFIVFDLHTRLAKRLQSNPKLFAANTSLFSTVQDIITTTVSLHHDLTKISKKAVQWNMHLRDLYQNKN